jgi:hypothetical protein
LFHFQTENEGDEREQGRGVMRENCKERMRGLGRSEHFNHIINSLSYLLSLWIIQRTKSPIEKLDQLYCVRIIWPFRIKSIQHTLREKMSCSGERERERNNQIHRIV